MLVQRLPGNVCHTALHAGDSSMDVLRFLLRLPLLLLRALYWLINRIVGGFRNAPAGCGVRRRERLAGGSRAPDRFATGMALAFPVRGRLVRLHWYQSATADQPPATFTSQAPEVTDYEQTPMLSSTDLRSIARWHHRADGEQASAGYRAETGLAGKWTWASDHELNFAEKDDWPVSQDFDLHLIRLAFAGMRVEKDRAQFKARVLPRCRPSFTRIRRMYGKSRRLTRYASVDTRSGAACAPETRGRPGQVRRIRGDL